MPDPSLTVLIGNNGTGKTAVLEALLRLLSVNPEQRRIRPKDFHVPTGEDPASRPSERELSIDIVMSFPELLDDSGGDTIPEFFQQMSCDEDGVPKLRWQLFGEWTEDGSAEGSVTESRRVVRTLTDDIKENEWSELRASSRSRIQMIYVPVRRDGARQVDTFLKSRVWRAAKWSSDWRSSFIDASKKLNTAFSEENAVAGVTSALKDRWSALHPGRTDSIPVLRTVGEDIEEIPNNINLYFEPTETGLARPASQLSDGQRSLLHIALTASALDIEKDLASGKRAEEFEVKNLTLPYLTILAIEEPENSLSPFYLSRIVDQLQSIGCDQRAQTFISSHAPSVMARVEPTQVRHFRLNDDLTSTIREIELPEDDDEASKYVREAVRRFPELYFAQFVVLGEGSSESVVLPVLAEARGLSIDQSFVAVVPLGGRHVNHLWRLLNQLEIPHATLLDLDLGREGAGLKRIEYVKTQLGRVGIKIGETDGGLDEELSNLRKENVFFCNPLDLDWELLRKYRTAYTTIPADRKGPGSSDATKAVLGENGDATNYANYADDLRWYRYLFLNRSKPSTHLEALASLTVEQLADCPKVLGDLLDSINEKL